MTTEAKLLISIGAAGGSLALYGDTSDPDHSRYKVVMVDQTLTFLNEDEGGPEIRRDSGWLPTWAAAMEALDRYPWPNLAGLYVDPAVAGDVWAAIQDYQKRAGQPIRDGALDRWRGVCGL